MELKVAFHPAAAEELLAAVEYYRTALPELGGRFAQAVQHATDVAATHPEAGPPRGTREVRRLVVVGFLYDLVCIDSGTRSSRSSRSRIIGVVPPIGGTVTRDDSVRCTA